MGFLGEILPLGKPKNFKTTTSTKGFLGKNPENSPNFKGYNVKVTIFRLLVLSLSEPNLVKDHQSTYLRKLQKKL